MKKWSSLFFMLLLLFFFDLPVDAAEYTFEDSGTKNITTSSVNGSYYSWTSDYIVLKEDVDPDAYYNLDIEYTIGLSSSVSGVVSCNNILYLGYYNYLTGWQFTLPYSGSFTTQRVVKGSELSDGSLRFYFRSYILSPSSGTVDVTLDLNFYVNSFTMLSSDQEAAYQSGYSVGYSEGESAGYSNGYSNGYSDGESSGYSEGFDLGFLEGTASVDTQSYYDAGYDAGYAAAYTSGYDTGYDEGYTAAMDRVDSWGADTTNYPVIVGSLYEYDFDGTYYTEPNSHYLYNSMMDHEINGPMSLNPDHTYRLSFWLNEYHETRSSGTSFDSMVLKMDVGGHTYPLSTVSGSITHFFVPGEFMSNTFRVISEIYSLENITDDFGYATFTGNYDFLVFDYGPAGDTQNHIANQTDKLLNTDPDNTGNYNDSNSAFNDTISDAHSLEVDLTSDAFTNVGAATSEFFSQPSNQVLAGAAFYSACVTGLYNSLGDFKYFIVVALMFIILRFIFRKVKAG